MNADQQDWDRARALCESGVLSAVQRVGFPSIWTREDNDLDLHFAGPGGLRTFSVGVKSGNGATDLKIVDGSSRDLFFAKWQDYSVDEIAEAMASWEEVAETGVDWAIGSVLSQPQRIEMTSHYRATVGFSFACLRDGVAMGRLVLFAESDLIFIAREEDPGVAGFALRPIV